MVSQVLFYVYRISLFFVGILLLFSNVKTIIWTYVWGTNLENAYDYIIVGGGTAGAVIAGRLARFQGMSVLVLEAGGPPPTWDMLGLMNVPLMGPLWQQSYMDWSYVTTPQYDACQGLQDSVSRWPRGRVLGGTARLNNMIYLRGHGLDWDEWEKAGGPEWGRESMMYYLRKSERQVGSYVNDSIHHRRTGWLPLVDSPLTGLGAAVLEGVRQLGFPVRDLNGAHQEGFMRAQLTSLNGARFTPDRAFLRENLRNLHVLTNAHVDRVLLNSNTEAYGVEFRRNGFSHRVNSRHAVVLSAGTVGSPTILMHSGIGPKDLLRSLNIPVKANLPVGQNLQDHMITGLDLVVLNTSLAMNLAYAFSPKSAFDYFFKGKGPWTHAGCEVVGVWRSKRANDTCPPDLQMMVLPAGVASDGGALIRRNFGISDKVITEFEVATKYAELWEGYFEPISRRADLVSVTLGITLLHPVSRGEVSIQSSDPRSAPMIDPNYLSDPADVDTLIEGIDMIRLLIRTRAMAELGASINPRKIPGCKSLPFFSRRYWQCYIRTLSLTAYHPVGTCRMGPKSDPESVVDRNLKVHGIRKLYVADASIMPTLPSANPMAAVIAIGEKMADILQKERESDSETTCPNFNFAQTAPHTTKREHCHPEKGCADEPDPEKRQSNDRHPNGRDRDLDDHEHSEKRQSGKQRHMDDNGKRDTDDRHPDKRQSDKHSGDCRSDDYPLDECRFSSRPPFR